MARPYNIYMRRPARLSAGEKVFFPCRWSTARPHSNYWFQILAPLKIHGDFCYVFQVVFLTWLSHILEKKFYVSWSSSSTHNFSFLLFLRVIDSWSSKNALKTYLLPCNSKGSISVTSSWDKRAVTKKLIPRAADWPGLIWEGCWRSSLSSWGTW